MKKLLLTVVASLAFCGAIFAQHTSHWAYFDLEANPFEMSDIFAAFIKIDGNVVAAENHYADLEIAAFQEDGDGQCRGHAFMTYHPEFDDPYPVLELSVFRNMDGDVHPIVFRMYDHASGIEYTSYAMYMDGVAISSINNGVDHDELYNAYPANTETGLLLDFTTPPTFPKAIAGYGSNPGGYYLIASPIGEINPVFVQHMLENEYDLYWFNQSGDPEGNQWMNYKVESFNLAAGKGYLYANSQDVTLEFTNDPYDGEGVFPLVYDASSPFNMAGVNLVGNPYSQTAYVNGRSFYVMNGEGTQIVPSESNSVQPMEGIFVVAGGAGESVTFSTTDGGKGSMVALNLSDGRSVLDRAIVSFDEDRALPKFQLWNTSKVYIPRGGEDYAVVRSDEQGEIPVGFKAVEDGSYTLSLSSENAAFRYLHLVDNLTGADIDLLQTPAYGFEAHTTDYAGRFSLVYCLETAGVGENFAFVSNGQLIVNGEGTLQVFDALGRQLLARDLSASHASLSTSNLPAGVYVLHLTDGDNVRTQKIVVR